MNILNKIFGNQKEKENSKIKNNTDDNLNLKDSSVQFILRKNRFYYGEHEFHLGKATEVLDIKNTFSEIKPLFLKETLRAINNMAGDGFIVEGSKMKDIYKYFLYRNVIKEDKQLCILKDENKLYKDIFNSDNYYMHLDKVEDVEVFNHFYNVNSVEILVTNQDYLLASKWNEKYFELTNQEIPSTDTNYNYDQIFDDRYISKGLYIDELDFWTNLIQDIGAFHFLSHYYSINIDTLSENDKKKDWISKGIIIEENILKCEDKDNPLEYYWMNNLLSEPPIIFEKIAIQDYFSHQLQSYKDSVIQAYLDTRFVPSHYYSHEQIMNEKEFNFWSHLCISQKLAKSIIESNLEEVNKKSDELIKRYQR